MREAELTIASYKRCVRTNSRHPWFYGATEVRKLCLHNFFACILPRRCLGFGLVSYHILYTKASFWVAESVHGHRHTVLYALCDLL